MGDDCTRPRPAAAEIIYADSATCIDNGDTIRCVLTVNPTDGGDVPRVTIVVMPRSGFMLSLVATAERFLHRGRSAAEGVAAVIAAGLTLH